MRDPMQQSLNTIMYLVLAFIVFFIILCTTVLTEPRGKYVIKAGERTYYCNKFTVTGNTIYFTDVNKSNVCISGQYTLIYEKKETEN